LTHRACEPAEGAIPVEMSGPAIAKRIRDKIEASGRSESAIALAMGVSRTVLSTTLRNLEDGAGIRTDTLARLGVELPRGAEQPSREGGRFGAVRSAVGHGAPMSEAPLYPPLWVCRPGSALLYLRVLPT
jgi:hypothetical protein